MLWLVVSLSLTNKLLQTSCILQSLALLSQIMYNIHTKVFVADGSYSVLVVYIW